VFEAKGFFLVSGGFCGCSPALRPVSDGMADVHVQYNTIQTVSRRYDIRNLHPAQASGVSSDML